MKHVKYYLSVLMACLFFVSGLMAQAPQNRTVSTIVVDALAQLPAKTPAQYNQTMGDLVSTGEEGLMILIKMMGTPGSKNNETVEYAISGWTNFVAGDNVKRSIAAGTYEKALNLSLDVEVKAFLIRQLEVIGGDDNTGVLSGFLSDKRLSGPSSQALVALHTEKADIALLTALQGTASDETRIILVNAIGQTGNVKAEPVFLGLLKNNPSSDLINVLFKALGNVGTSESLGILKTESEKVNYSLQKGDAVPAYIHLLKKVAGTDPLVAQKPAEDLLLQASKLGKPEIQVAATEILMSLPDTDKNKLLEKAFKGGNIVYITGALNACPSRNDEKMQKLVIGKLRTKSPEVQTAVLYWLGNQKVENAVPKISKYLYSADKDVRTAAVRSLSTIGGKDALAALAQLLESKDSESVSLARQALLAYDGDMSGELASVFHNCGDEGKIAVLQLVASRQMKSQYSLVYSLMSTDNDKIKAEAVQTLKYVVTDKNIPELFNLVEQSDAKYTASIQEAINAALSILTPDQQMTVVSDRMNKSDKRYLYYSALANIGTQPAMDAIIKAYNSETGESKQAAFDALTKWKSFNVIYPLLDILRNTKSTDVMSQSTDAIVSLLDRSGQTGEVKRLFLQEIMQFAQTDKQKNEIIHLLGTTNSYQAMLFVEPFMNESAIRESAAQAAMAIALNNPSFAGEKTTEILDKVSKALSNPDAAYQRQAIQKYLSENPKEDGFVSMFNGKDLDGWKGLVGNPITRAKMSKDEMTKAQAEADKTAAKDWQVVNGELIFSGGFDNLCTNKKYGDFEMLVDWKLYPGPEPDAGIYLRGTPQVQIWDTSRVNVGAQVGSGGLYNNQTNLSKPLKVADLKVGEWNTFRIRMIGDRVTVYLNGELVTDNIILENFWDRSLPIFPSEQIELQAHGSKVGYRNIYIKEIARPEPFKLSKEEEKEGFKVLFDGTNMHEWTGNTTDYVTENGNIVIYPSERFGGNLYTKNEYSDFVYRFEFQLTPGANNGVGIRTPMEGDAAYVGMEIQVLDNEDPIYKDLQIYQYHGSVYGVIPARRGFLKPLGEWNTEEIYAKGDHIKVTLNGTVILDGNIREAAKNGTMDHKDHPGLFNKKGHIGFLGHGSVVKFRNIRVKEL